MPRRVAGPCPTPGCPNRAGQCAQHKRGTSTQRGYGAEHQRIRAGYQRRMDRGESFRCWRCKRPIDQRAWHLGHDDIDRSKYRGPECIPCNDATSGRGG